MAKPIPSMPLVLTLGISIVALNSLKPAMAEIYRCTNAAGEVEYADEPCPAGFASDALDIQSRPDRGASDPYSPIEQVKRLEWERERRAQLRREREALSERRPQTADSEPRAREDALEAARAAQARAEQAQREAQLKAQREAEKRAQAEKELLDAKNSHTKEPRGGLSAPSRNW